MSHTQAAPAPQTRPPTRAYKKRRPFAEQEMAMLAPHFATSAPFLPQTRQTLAVLLDRGEAELVRVVNDMQARAFKEVVLHAPQLPPSRYPAVTEISRPCVECHGIFTSLRKLARIRCEPCREGL